MKAECSCEYYWHYPLDHNESCPIVRSGDYVIKPTSVYTVRNVPIGLYHEAMSTYPSIRPLLTNARWACYDLPQDEWEHLLYMARCHLEAQITGASNEDGHVTKCRRYLKQLEKLEDA